MTEPRRFSTDLPVIRLEVESMKLSIKRMLDEQAFMLDEHIKASVDAYCTPENIKGIVERDVARVIDVLVREEVDRYYRYGKGRDAIRAAVLETMRMDE